MKYSWEFLSLSYLNMWLKHDCHYYESLNNETRENKLTSIKEAATYYKIARNLPREHDEGIGLKRYQPVLNIINSVESADFKSDTLRSIGRAERRISRAYGGDGALSFTTKMLWLKIRDPIIIYDKQARNALNTHDGDLEGFYEAWQTEYSKHSKIIATVCDKLSSISKYAYDQTLATSEYVKDISKQPWFQKRVFDVYLWHVGL